MLTYWHIDTHGVVGFSDFDYVGYVDDKKSTSSYIFMMAEGVVFVEKCQADTYSFIYYIWCLMRLFVMQYGCGTSFQL